MRIGRKKGKIKAFISYRRATGREIARNIYERLSLNGINTFFDYDSMRNGKFNTQIYEAIEQASDFILIYSPGALDRCDNEDDWVRKEILHALQHEKNIIPVFTEPGMEFPDNLPPKLREIAQYQAVTLSQEYYDESIRSLIGRLSAHPWTIPPIKVFWMILALAVIALTVFFLSRQEGGGGKITPVKPSSVTAELYLPRYNDFNRDMLETPFFNDSTLNVFAYRDTIAGDQYIVYGTSSYLSTEFCDRINVFAGEREEALNCHSLPLRIRLENPFAKPVVLNHAVLELKDVSPLSFPVLSIADVEEGIVIKNENPAGVSAYGLKISTLREGESFLRYKEEIDVEAPEVTYHVDKGDSIMGEINDASQSWKFSQAFTGKSSVASRPRASREGIMAPRSSETGVYEVTVSSLKSSQDLLLQGFNRKLKKDEIDDDMYLIISSDYNFQANVRLKLTSTDGREIYSPYVRIIHLRPLSFTLYPF